MEIGIDSSGAVISDPATVRNIDVFSSAGHRIQEGSA